jgi:cobalt transporter subunit CbtA
MFQRIFVSALLAGIVVGLLVAGLQHVGLVPMILEAEKYESGTGTAHKHAEQSSAQQAAQPSAAAPEESSPWRHVLTFLATTLTAIGFGFLLAGAFAISGREVSASEGLLWGLAGFAGFALAPAFGLPPELPGAVAADLFARQLWWIGTVAATLAGLGLLVFVRNVWAALVALVLLAVPHVIGAPHPHEGAGLVPPELAASFAARSLAVNAVFWALLGLATGALYARFGRAVPRAPRLSH